MIDETRKEQMKQAILDTGWCFCDNDNCPFKTLCARNIMHYVPFKSENDALRHAPFVTCGAETMEHSCYYFVHVNTLSDDGICALTHGNGIARVHNPIDGAWHSCHPNIHGTESVAGMKKLGYWRDDARTVKAYGFIYNIDVLSIHDEYDEIASKICRCRACQERREEERKREQEGRLKALEWLKELKEKRENTKGE